MRSAIKASDTRTFIEVGIDYYLANAPLQKNLYSDDKFNHDGGIPSGPSGSGIFPISLLLMCSVTVTVLAKVAVFVPEKAEE